MFHCPIDILTIIPSRWLVTTLRILILLCRSHTWSWNISSKNPFLFNFANGTVWDVSRFLQNVIAVRGPPPRDVLNLLFRTYPIYIYTAFNSFGAKFLTTFVVCFFILINYRLERRLYIKLKDWMSNSVDPDETAHWAVSSGSMLFAEAYYFRRSKDR